MKRGKIQGGNNNEHVKNKVSGITSNIPLLIDTITIVIQKLFCNLYIQILLFFFKMNFYSHVKTKLHFSFDWKEKVKGLFVMLNDKL